MPNVSSNHVSVVSRERALENIRRKVRLLDLWIDDKHIPWKEAENGQTVRSSDGEQVLEWFPRTVVEFARWTGAENSPVGRRMIKEFGGFETFGRSTLDRAQTLKESVLRVLRDVGRMAHIQAQSSNRSSAIESLKLAVEAERARKQEAQRLYVDSLSKINKLDRDLINERQLRTADIERLTQELNDVRSQNAELVARNRKSKALHVAGGRDG